LRLKIIIFDRMTGCHDPQSRHMTGIFVTVACYNSMIVLQSSWHFPRLGLSRP